VARAQTLLFVGCRARHEPHYAHPLSDAHHVAGRQRRLFDRAGVHVDTVLAAKVADNPKGTSPDELGVLAGRLGTTEPYIAILTAPEHETVAVCPRDEGRRKRPTHDQSAVVPGLAARAGRGESRLKGFGVAHLTVGDPMTRDPAATGVRMARWLHRGASWKASGPSRRSPRGSKATVPGCCSS
jgi:hypothetical protein